MQNNTMMISTLGVAGCLLLSGAASAQIAYDTLGFEPGSGFVPGFSLEGQGGGTPERVFQAAGNPNAGFSSIVSAGTGVGGSVSATLEVTGTAGFDDASVGVIVPFNGSAVPDGPVTVSLDMNVFAQPVDDFLFGFTVFGQGNPNETVPFTADILVDPTNGNVFRTAEDFTFQPTGQSVTLGMYSSFELVLDYTSKTFTLDVDGSTSGPFGFVENANGVNLDAQGRTNDFSAVAFSVFDNGSANDDVGFAGTAFYDNLVVVPEPATMALAAFAGLGLLRRRRRAA